MLGDENDLAPKQSPFSILEEILLGDNYGRIEGYKELQSEFLSFQSLYNATDVLSFRGESAMWALIHMQQSFPQIHRIFLEFLT